MNMISASRFVDILRKDPLYSNKKLAMNVANFIALKNKIRLHFFGYLYGSKSTPVISVIPAEKYAQANRESQPHNDKIVYNFMPFPKETVAEFGKYNEMITNGSPGNANLVYEVLGKRREAHCKAREINDIHVHLITGFLATGLQFVYKDSLKKFDAKQILEFVTSLEGKSLLDMIDNAMLGESHIYDYFIDYDLPLPERVYPAERYNSKCFLEAFDASVWDNYNPIEDFKAFYRSPVRYQPVAQKDVIPAAALAPPANDEKQAQLESVGSPKDNYVFYKAADGWVVVFNGKLSLFDAVDGMLYIHSIIKAGESGISTEDLYVLLNGRIISEDDPMFDKTNSPRHGNENEHQDEFPSKDRNDTLKLIETINNEKEMITELRERDRISYETYEAQINELNKSEDFVSRMGKMGLNNMSEKISENVTKAIKRAMEKIRTSDMELYKHLFDPCRINNKMFRYMNSTNIKWKLSQ